MRPIPCTFIGKHLQFSDENIRDIIRIPLASHSASPKALVSRQRIQLPGKSLFKSEQIPLAFPTQWSVNTDRPDNRASAIPSRERHMAWIERHGAGWHVRYHRADGTLASEAGYTHPDHARNRAADIEYETRQGTFTEPRKAQTTFGEWTEVWSDAHDVA